LRVIAILSLMDGHSLALKFKSLDALSVVSTSTLAPEPNFFAL
jgi:hypothetical protein